MTIILFLKIFESSLLGKKPPEDIIVNAKFSALKLLIEIKRMILCLPSYNTFT